MFGKVFLFSFSIQFLSVFLLSGYFSFLSMRSSSNCYVRLSVDVVLYNCSVISQVKRNENQSFAAERNAEIANYPRANVQAILFANEHFQWFFFSVSLIHDGELMHFLETGIEFFN